MGSTEDTFNLGWLIIFGFVLLVGVFAVKNSRFGLNN